MSDKRVTLVLSWQGSDTSYRLFHITYPTGTEGVALERLDTDLLGDPSWRPTIISNDLFQTVVSVLAQRWTTPVADRVERWKRQQQQESAGWLPGDSAPTDGVGIDTPAGHVFYASSGRFPGWYKVGTRKMVDPPKFWRPIPPTGERGGL